MYLTGTGRAPVLLGQVRYHKASAVQVPVGCRPEEPVRCGEIPEMPPKSQIR